jgi:SAM-dependent methyltransferase
MDEGSAARPDYGVDAPGVLRNIFLFGFLCLALAIFVPPIRMGPVVVNMRSFLWPAGFLIGEGLLFLLYVKVGKFRHRDRMLALRQWRGDEQVLDVGCGRGLLLVGAAKKLVTGHATGIDIWSKEDLSGNAAEATEKNLALEGVSGRCTLVSGAAQEMPFTNESFDVVMSNLCLHNIYDRPSRKRALEEIVRVLKPGGTAILSDYKLTKEYAEQLRSAGLAVERGGVDWLRTFPPLRIVTAHKRL